MASRMLKYFFDFILAFVLLLLISPILLLIICFVRMKLGLPVFFRQVRPGMHGLPFEMLKFRSMIDRRDSHGQLLPDDQRLTHFGKILRSTSLDEFPALINVIKGEMSLVGPRPLLMEYLPLYNDEQRRRHEVKPGITGWAQVNGRNSLSWEERFRLDVWYVDNQSFLLDLKILFLTVKKVVVCEGVSAEGEATMSKFTGSMPEVGGLMSEISSQRSEIGKG